MNICLYWRIYGCMYHLEYMYIVSAYKYMLALAYLCMYHLEYMYVYVYLFLLKRKKSFSFVSLRSENNLIEANRKRQE